MRKYKTTFNYLLTHRVIPQLIFSGLDPFYESILQYPKRLQQFMQIATSHAAKQTEDNPNMEPPYPIETFQIGIYGEMERGIIWIQIPNCNQMCDCTAIAFPAMRENAGYFTCEISVNPIDNKTYFILGEWKIENDSFQHLNWGEIDDGNWENFFEMVQKIAYDT
jgi:hypothetical protein